MVPKVQHLEEEFIGGGTMICPRCLTEGEVAYSALSNGLVCLIPDCGWEQELDAAEAFEMLEAVEETALCA